MNSASALRTYFELTDENSEYVTKCETYGDFQEQLSIPSNIARWFQYNEMILEMWDQNEIEIMVWSGDKYTLFTDYIEGKPKDFCKIVLNEREMFERIFILCLH